MRNILEMGRESHMAERVWTCWYWSAPKVSTLLLSGLKNKSCENTVDERVAKTGSNPFKVSYAPVVSRSNKAAGTTFKGTPPVQHGKPDMPCGLSWLKRNKEPRARMRNPRGDTKNILAKHMVKHPVALQINTCHKLQMTKTKPIWFDVVTLFGFYLLTASKYSLELWSKDASSWE